MTPARAAEVLRGLRIRQSQGVRTACEMGADSLEFQTWLDGQRPDGWLRIGWLYTHWHGEDSFLDYARAEWEKERKG